MVYPCWLSNLNWKGDLICIPDLLWGTSSDWSLKAISIVYVSLQTKGIKFESPWGGLHWKCITYGGWYCIWYMSYILLSWIMRPIFLLTWYLRLSLGLLMTYVFQRFWIQLIIIKIRDKLIIIICTIEGLKGGWFWPKWRFLILSWMHSLRIVIKYQTIFMAHVSSL